MENINIENKEKFIKATPAEGYVITPWKDGGNILDYTFSKEMYFPLGSDLSGYSAITEERHNGLLKQMEEEREKIEIERLNERR